MVAYGMKRNVVKTTVAKTPKTKARPAKQSAPAQVAASTLPVTLAVKGLSARQVSVAGSFNDWSPEAAPMSCRDDGTWGVELRLAPGCYEYLLVADGSWIPDPSCPESVPNPYGGVNNVLRVG